MGTCAHAAAAGIFGVLGMVSLGATQAAEITVLTGQGVVSAVRDLAPAFERASGHKVVVGFESAPALMRKIEANASWNDGTLLATSTCSRLRQPSPRLTNRRGLS